MTQFWTQNIPALLGGGILIISRQYSWKFFGRILTTFPSLSTTLVGKVENRTWMTSICTWDICNCLVCNSYCFLSVQLKNVSIIFWRLVRAQTPPEQALSRQIWKPGLDDLILYQRHRHTIWGAILIVFHQYGRKMFWSNFDAFSEPIHN